MESNLAAAFMSEVHCDVDTAYSYLLENCWDINAAFTAWRCSHSSGTEEINTDGQVPQDHNDVKKLSRGISRATDNVNLVSRARCEFAKNFKQSPCFKMDRFFIDTLEFTFTLPDMNMYGAEFRKFLEKDLIENSALSSLEQCGRLNWWTDIGNGHSLCQRLWPLATTGDGNCLLHAASLAMWGFHDRLLTLRKALHTYLECSEHKEALYRRWRWQQTKLNEQSGFVYSESEWTKEWQNIVSMASTEPRRNGGAADRYGGGATAVNSGADDIPTSASTYESLEEIHVLALAHVLRRPIVVVADVMLRDMNNEPFAPIPFGGVYLPQLCPTNQCHRSPLLLTYDMGHFSALVVMQDAQKEKNNKACCGIPVTDSDGVLLPLQFSVDPGPEYIWTQTYEQNFINSLILTEREQIFVLREYLDIIDLSDMSNTSASPELDSEDEIEKRFTEVAEVTDADNTLFGNKNRAAKQLQQVARQFGSIGKSMSKKLKKNFGSITKVSKAKKNDGLRCRILCAEIHTKRHEYQEEMIKNYLLYAQKRFLQEQKLKLPDKDLESVRLQEQAMLEGSFKCINANCDSFGTVLTSYMCNKCFETQRNVELSKINTDSRFGAGKSKFYRDSNLGSYGAIKNLKNSKPNINKDRTLYLSKSTFYYDTGALYYTSAEDQRTEKKECLSEHSLTSANNHNNDNNTEKNNNSDIGNQNISKFNFYDFDQTLKYNHAVQDNNKRKALSNPALDANTYSSFAVASSLINQTGSLDFFMNKKKIKDHLMKNTQNGTEHNIQSNKENVGNLNDIFSTNVLKDLNAQGEAVNLRKPMQVTNYEKRTDVSYNLLRKYPAHELGTSNGPPLKTTKMLGTLADRATFKQCKTNFCENLATVQTDFYCKKCHKDRKIAGIII